MVFTPVKLFLKRGAHFVSRHAPTLLTVVGAGGVVSSVIFAIQATPKAERLIQQKKKALDKLRLTPLETVQACWKVYVPTVGMAATAIGCMVWANCINLKRNAALAGLLVTSRQEFGELHKKLVESVGEEKAKEIHEQVQQKLAEGQAQPSGGMNRATVMRCIDGLTGQTFMASRDQLDMMHYLMRDMIHNEGSVSHNEQLELFQQRPVDDGEGTGWTDQTGFEIKVTLEEENGEYYYRVNYLIPPVERYNYIY